MSKTTFKHGAWALICDNRKAIFAINEGDEAAPNLRVHKTMEHPDERTRELGTDKPGRAFSGADDRRSAMEPTDFHRLSEEAFLAKVAAVLEREVSERKIEYLIIAAPPQTTGTLRKLLSPAVQKVLQCEVEKDYVRVPLHTVEQRLAKHLQESSVHQ